MKRLYGLGAGLLLSSALLGCEPPRPAAPVADKPAARAAAKNTATQVRRQGNVTVTTSTDTARLGRLLKLRRFRPARAQYRYTFIDNSGGLVPGPSDHRLEAVLWFDSLTFRRLVACYHAADYPPPGLRKQQFNFAWLPAAVRTELLTNDSGHQGAPDLVFSAGPGGTLWFLSNTILLRNDSH
jgi:hypothetical protein